MLPSGSPLCSTPSMITITSVLVWFYCVMMYLFIGFILSFLLYVLMLFLVRSILQCNINSVGVSKGQDVDIHKMVERNAKEHDIKLPIRVVAVTKPSIN